MRNQVLNCIKLPEPFLSDVVNKLEDILNSHAQFEKLKS